MQSARKLFGRNSRSRQTPAQKVRVAVPVAGHVQVPADQVAAGAHTVSRPADQEDISRRRHGAARRVRHVTVLQEQQQLRFRAGQPGDRGRGGPHRPGGRVRATHGRLVGRLFVVRAATGHVPAEHRLQGLLQEPDGRRVKPTVTAGSCDGYTTTPARTGPQC